ncbi:MAG: hypothetical protein GF333_08125 [Candidatus Omnitrophica bacterium]|nr:hypothetical protein [Candidatus Omnitrophota bacterium]
MEEKRTHPRAAVSFPIECSLQSEKAVFYTVSTDLSLGGTRIVTEEPFREGKELTLRINLIERTVKLKAQVRWSGRGTNSHRFVAGIQFNECTGENRQILNGFLKRIFNS